MNQYVIYLFIDMSAQEERKIRTSNIHFIKYNPNQLSFINSYLYSNIYTWVFGIISKNPHLPIAIILSLVKSFLC